jgi:hypothetical protein
MTPEWPPESVERAEALRLRLRRPECGRLWPIIDQSARLAQERKEELENENTLLFGREGAKL